MKISHDGTTVSFKTEPEELFLAEKSGAKPNTVRIVDQDEYLRLVKANPKKIFIQHQQEIFLRTITNVHVTEGVFGKVIVVISWTNEKHYHDPLNQTDPIDPWAHTMSLDKDLPTPPHEHIMLSQEDHLAAETAPTTEEGEEDKKLALIGVSKGLSNILVRLAYNRSMDTVIRELYQIYLDKRAEETGPMHD